MTDRQIPIRWLSMSTEIEKFLSTIEQFLSESGTSPTRFGREFAGDNSFVFDLRKGREPRSEVRRRVIQAMEASSSFSTGASLIHSDEVA